MSHHYHIAVTDKNKTNDRGIEFDIDSHDDLYQIVQRARQLNIFEEEQAAAFAVGIKLFGQVLLQHKNHLMLAAFAPHFGDLMRIIKEKSKQSI